MKKVLERKKIMLAGIIGACCMLIVLIGILFVTPMIASAATNQGTPTPTTANKKAQYCEQFDQDLAKKLNVSVDTLRQDRKSAASDTIDQMVKDGKLKQARADKLKQQLNKSTGNACPTFTNHKQPKNFAILNTYRQDAVAQIAQGLHLNSDQLLTQIKAGKTLVTIAQEQKVSSKDLQTLVQNTIQSVLKKAVNTGILTQKRADAISTFAQKHPQLIQKMLRMVANKTKGE